MDGEDEVKLLLCGTSQEQNQGVAMLYESYSKPLWSFILQKFPGLNHADVGEIVNDTFVVVWRGIEKGTLDINRPLRSFLFAVAQNKAIDVLRKYTSRIDRTVDDDIVDVADRIQGSEVGLQWRHAVTAGKVAAIQDAFRLFLRTLPDVQRNVAQVMADNFPDELGQEETANEIFRRMGEQTTVAGVKRARSEIRQKFKKFLEINKP